MADYPGIILDYGDLILARVKTVRFSGIVEDSSSNPLKRTVIGYCYPAMDIPSVTESAASDGSWDLEIKAAPGERFIIATLGATSENAEIFDWIEG